MIFYRGTLGMKSKALFIAMGLFLAAGFLLAYSLATRCVCTGKPNRFHRCMGSHAG